MKRIAIYDMDKTITRRATFVPFACHVVFRYRPLRIFVFPIMVLAAFAYASGFISRTRLKEINLRMLLGRAINASNLGKMAGTFAQSMVSDNVLPAALRQIAADRAEGYHIVMATASCRFYAENIAHSVDIADVIATENRITAAGQILPLIDGENCYGDAKLRMVKEWLSRQGIDRNAAHIRFYSDHVTDAPCLVWADEAFAINAHAPLSRLAHLHGWKRLDWLSLA